MIGACPHRRALQQHACLVASSAICYAALMSPKHLKSSRRDRLAQREEASLVGRLLRASGSTLALIVAAGVCSCSPKAYLPELATQPYPRNLHTTTVADIQVFRRGTDIEIVNSTARSYTDINLWVNQRYVLPIDSLAAGTTKRVSLWNFFDEYGERFYAGGFFRTYPATPVRMVEIQTKDDQPMIGLIAIRSEDIKPITKQ